MTTPYSPESERALLGSILMRPELIYSVRGLLVDTDFYEHKNRLIFESMLSICDSNRHIDSVSVGEHLQRHGNFSAAGGTKYIGGLLDAVATTVHAPSLARQIKALSAQRGVLSAAQEIAAAACSPQDNIEEFLGTSMSRIMAAAAANTGADPIHVGHEIQRVAETAMSGEKTIMREPSGITEMDNKIYGLPRKKITVVGGRPSMGKSSIALAMSKHVQRRGAVLYFTLEDDIQSQQSRLISSICGVPYFDLDGGLVDSSMHSAITMATAQVNDMQIWFEERRLTVDEICQKAIAFGGIHGIRLCIIDHLGYISLSRAEQKMTKYEYTSLHARRLAFLAKELKCPVVLLVQLNRSVDARPDHRPRLSDLRDSGTIEEDARQVILLYRDAVYNTNANPEDIDIIIAKNTQGPIGTLSTVCDLKCCRIGGGREY